MISIAVSSGKFNVESLKLTAKDPPASQSMTAVLYLAAVRTMKSYHFHRAAVSVLVGGVANSPMMRGIELKFPRAWARSASRDALSEVEPQIVRPNAVAVKSPVAIRSVDMEEGGSYRDCSSGRSEPMGWSGLRLGA